MEPIEDRVKRIVAEQFAVPVERIRRGTLLADDLNGDSLDVVELVMGLEDEFDISIDDATADKLRTFGDVVDHVTHKLSVK